MFVLSHLEVPKPFQECRPVKGAERILLEEAFGIDLGLAYENMPSILKTNKKFLSPYENR